MLPLQVAPVQEMVDSLAALLQLDVEIVDRRLNRVGASGSSRRLVGRPQERGFVSSHVLNTGNPVLMLQPGRDHVCTPCDRKNRCKYRAGLACPITHQGTVVGVVSLSGFTDNQCATIHQGGDQILKHISNLFSGLAFPSLLEPTEPQPTVTRTLCPPQRPVTPLWTGDPFEAIVGQSESIAQTVAKARRLARNGTVILLSGETGTGKELFAAAIHAVGRMAAGPMIAVNCAAIPETLLESELFGYEEGAFTGARRGGKAGKFELAAGGTLFLDEVGELPLNLQPKLLRALEYKSVDRVGSTVSQRINLQVVAASNRDLRDQVKKGLFRADLYYRLAGLTVQVPPLRERRQDIGLLANHFLAELCREQDLPRLQFSRAVMHTLEAYDWPGNVRELKNAVEYAATMSEGPQVELADLPDELLRIGHRSLQERLEAYERELLFTALEHIGRNVEGKREVAESLGISLPTLYRRLKDLDLSS